MSKEAKITPQQRLFIHEYLVDLNATKAAERAGYSEKTAYSIGHELLHKPHIAAEIQIMMDMRARKVGVNAETVLSELLRIATVDIGDAYDDQGRLLPVKEIPADVRRAIAGIKIFEEFEGSGDSRIQVGEVREVKFWDKIKANELLGKHLKLFIDRLEIEDKNKIGEKMAKARKRANEGK